MFLVVISLNICFICLHKLFYGC